jgi:hypothetical protein
MTKSARNLMAWSSLASASFVAMGTAYASSINVQTMIPSTSNRYVLTEDALPKQDCCKGLTLGVNYIYLNDPLVAIDPTTNTRTETIVDSINTVDLMAAYRFGDHFALGIGVPLSSVAPPSGSSELAAGDMRAWVKVRFTDVSNPLGLALMPEIRIPTGSVTNLTSDDSLGFGFRFIAEQELGPVSVAAHVGYWRFSGSELENIVMKNRIPLGLGVLIPLDRPTRRWAINLELNGQPAIPVSSNSAPSVAYAGMRYQPYSDMSLSFGATVGKFSGPGSADFGLIAGLRMFMPTCSTSATPPVVPATPVAAAPVAPAKPKQRVVYTPAAIEINEEVQFRNNSDVLLPTAKDLLREVAQVIKAHMGEFKKIQVEGHANALGSPEKNMVLSQKACASTSSLARSRPTSSRPRALVSRSLRRSQALLLWSS